LSKTARAGEWGGSNLDRLEIRRKFFKKHTTFDGATWGWGSLQRYS